MRRRSLTSQLAAATAFFFAAPADVAAMSQGSSGPTEEQPQPSLFHLLIPGSPGSLRHRDLELFFSDLYRQARLDTDSSLGITYDEKVTLDALARTLAEGASNPFGSSAGLHPIYDYFNTLGSYYDPNPDHSLGLLVGNASRPTADRDRVDVYICDPGEKGRSAAAEKAHDARVSPGTRGAAVVSRLHGAPATPPRRSASSCRSGPAACRDR
jgi:hypothetical protein